MKMLIAMEVHTFVFGVSNPADFVDNDKLPAEYLFRIPVAYTDKTPQCYGGDSVKCNALLADRLMIRNGRRDSNRMYSSRYKGTYDVRSWKGIRIKRWRRIKCCSHLFS